jgi:transposase
MKYVGVDLHKKTITIAVVDVSRKMLTRRRFSNRQTEEMAAFLAGLGDFTLTVEATASYEWFVCLVEPLAVRVVLAHPKKLRIIAESTRKSDKLDARTLAQMLAYDQIPSAYRPTPRQRAHRRLVRHRAFLQRRITSLRNKVRHILADYNLDRPDLFTEVGQEYLAGLALPEEDRFVVDQLLQSWRHYRAQLQALMERLRAFAAQGSAQEKEDRRRLLTIPGVGEVTAEVVLAELADPRRFSSAKRAVSYAGLAPGQRESAGKRRQLTIEKTGSPLLRWVLVQAAWQLVQRSLKWNRIYDQLEARVGRKKAIIAVTRRLLCVAHALLRREEDYREFLVVADIGPPQEKPRGVRPRSTAQKQKQKPQETEILRA